jgi:DNA-binding NarL/FixJ family response regulator
MTDTRYVAIVDDHALFRKGLANLVNLFPNYKVLFDAGDGKEFISELKPPHLPDIVLLDITMPGMDGYMTADWLRINYPEIKVLALSTMDSDTAIIKMIKLGARGYILKDAQPTELKLALEEVFAKGYFYNEMVSRKVLQSVNQLINEHSDINAFLKLTAREQEFIKLACTEKSYSQIAGEMFVSERTVDGYRESLFRKLNVGTRVGLVMYAIKNGLVKI